ITYVAVGSSLQAYDLRTQSLLQNVSLGASLITGLASEGSFLYVMSANRALRAVDISDPTVMTPRGSLTMPAGPGKLAVGNDIAYLCAGNGNTGGFATANVSDPDSLA